MANKKDLAAGVLANDLSSSGTAVDMEVGSTTPSVYGAMWPDAQFYITVMPAAPDGGVANLLDSEIMLVTAKKFLDDPGGSKNNYFTVTRGQKGTTARAFSAGAIVVNGVYSEDVGGYVWATGSSSSPVTPSPWVTPDITTFQDYSTTEKVIGKWTDGSDIYRYTATLDPSGASSDAKIGELPSAVSKVIKISATLYNSVQSLNIPIPFFFNTSNWGAVWVQTNGEIWACIPNNNYRSGDIKISVEYVKSS